MKLLSIEYIPGVEFEALGIVKGTVVQTKNVGKDFMAGMKTLREIAAHPFSRWDTKLVGKPRGHIRFMDDRRDMVMSGSENNRDCYKAAFREKDIRFIFF